MNAALIHREESARRSIRFPVRSRTVAELLLDYLKGEGVDTVFGIPGGPATPIFDALMREPAIRTIAARHEAGAAFMASGYARMTGRLGAAILTTGPGATNALTGIAAAKTDSLPVLCITAQVATLTFGKGSLQDSTVDGINTVDIFRPATKYSAMLANPKNFPSLIRRAIREAMTGRRGPVHISLPTDFLKRPCAQEILAPALYRPASYLFDREAVKRASLALLEAKSPVVLAGHGVNIGDAKEELSALAGCLGIPVASTPKGKGAFPENHPLALGIFGQASSPAAEEKLLSSSTDLLFAIGTSLHEISTQGWEKRLSPSGDFLHLDIDPTVIGRNYPVSIPLVGDIKTTLREILFEINRLLSRGEAKRNNNSIPALPPENGTLKVPEPAIDGSPMRPQHFMKELDEALPDDAAIFIDIGNHALWAIHYLEARQQRSFVHNWGEFAAMGTAVAGAVGGKLGAPGRPVFAVCGDGGFAMAGMEVLTATTYNIPVIWIIFNDGRFNTVHHGMQMQYEGRTNATEFRQMDIAGIALALGARAEKVRTPGKIAAAIRSAIASNAPTVIEVFVDRDEPPPIQSRVEALNRFFAESNEELCQF